MKRGNITGTLMPGGNSRSNPTIAMLRRVKSSRNPKQSVTSKPRTIERYGKPAPITLAPVPTLDKPIDDD